MSDQRTNNEPREIVERLQGLVRPRCSAHPDKLLLRGYSTDKAALVLEAADTIESLTRRAEAAEQDWQAAQTEVERLRAAAKGARFMLRVQGLEAAPGFKRLSEAIGD